jgi:hypothetical protein
MERNQVQQKEAAKEQASRLEHASAIGFHLSLAGVYPAPQRYSKASLQSVVQMDYVQLINMDHAHLHPWSIVFIPTLNARFALIESAYTEDL